MDLNSMKQLLKNTDVRRAEFQRKCDESFQYYQNQNLITNKTGGESKINNDGKGEAEGSALRRADYRVSSNFHQLLVDQKVNYLTGIAPTIDVGSNDTNKLIQEALGDDFGPALQEECVDAANAGVGWLHVWHDDAENRLRFAVIPPEQITPLYQGDTDRTLLAVRRQYAEIDPDTGKQFTCIEFWDKQSVTAYKTTRSDYEDLAMLKRYILTDATTGEPAGDPSATLDHKMGQVPFIPFFNNKHQTGDLRKYKGLIDVYDQVYNGFANDLADVQQVVLVLTNYGGVDLKEFWDNLRKDKAIKLDSVTPDDKSGVNTLTIDIPVEARKTLLEITEDGIWEHGQGVNPKQLTTGSNLTGVAIKLLYGQLELSTSMVETWFRKAVSELVRFILRDQNVKDADTLAIKQTWTRSLISNDTERADMIAKLADHTSREAIAKNNPFVDDWQEELQNQDDDADHEADQKAKHPDPFANLGAGLPKDDSEDDSEDDDNSDEHDVDDE